MIAPTQLYQFSVEDYHRMGEAGIIAPDERVELLEGQVVPMSPIGYLHAVTVDFLTDWFGERVRRRAVVRIQGPVTFAPRNEPQPDVQVLRPPLKRYRKAPATGEDVLLLIEVADSSLERDRGLKKEIYAKAGIADSWIVDLTQNRIEVYRAPQGTEYKQVETFDVGQSITPLALPDLSLKVAEVFGGE